LALVATLKSEYGLNQTLRLLGVPKSSWYYAAKHQREQAKRHQDLKQDLLALARNHPDYGYRRNQAELVEKHKRPINHKLVQKLMQTQELITLRSAHRPPESPIRQILLKLKDRMNLYAPLLAREAAGTVAIGIFQVFTTDFTEIIYDQGGMKMQLIPFIDHTSKYCPGYALGPTPTSEVAITALNHTASGVEKLGYTLTEALVHHDQGSAFISFEWLVQTLVCYTMRISYSLRGAKDNPAQESFNGRFKKENRDLFWECRTETEVTALVAERIKYYNEKRRHSSIGYLSPLAYIKKYGKRR
jgi:putative transposase